MSKIDVIIVGGGLAGLIAAIHLRNHNYEVLVLEKNDFPKHKVCGEYISNEVLGYLVELGLDISSLCPKKIDQLSFSLVSGKTINITMTMGGFGISRYALDYYLYDQAKKNGAVIVQEMVADITFFEDCFTVSSDENQYTSKIVMGAFGKRSNLDVKFKRSFIQKPSNWLGVKAHYALDFPDNLVGLHHFKGGYCGVSKIENNLVNICYLANYDTFKLFKNVEEYQEKMVSQNPNLRAIFEKAILKFDKPLAISQISFEKKKAVEHHVLMIGDTAGLIHPLCGNGMAMAIHSAKLASETVIQYLENKSDRAQMEADYQKTWNTHFKLRLKMGRLLGFALRQENTAQLLMKVLLLFPFLLPMIVRKTHGKTI
jgi:menaquinone-9 beta-reductase